jgi:hypothetical protein
MHPALFQPRGIFTCEIEPEPRDHVTDKVVDGAEAVKRPTKLAAQNRVHPPRADRCSRDLEDPAGAHRFDELLIASVRFNAPRENDSDRARAVVAKHRTEE